ncbi:MAG: dTDP-4-dehydrorhamnose 3,5-epimerase family protein [Chloroflexi bacterium]|nr:dTDP-4-dehydrorhamnose 3,5-epimerase family protein [Chloroflexota bacterium]
MHIEKTKLEGSYLVIPAPVADSRGYFMRTFDNEIFREHGLQTLWAQESQSLTVTNHTVLGVHFQRSPNAEIKLLRVLRAAILDVFVDTRLNSPTYGNWDSIKLSEANSVAGYIPKGFGHGFCTLTESTVASYKMDSAYASEANGYVRRNNPALDIKWPTMNPTHSDNDKNAPLLRDVDPIDIGRGI